MGKLDGKVALITGGARGIGRVYAHHLASLGASIAIIDRDLQSFRGNEHENAAMTAENSVEEILAAGGRAAGAEADVGNPEQVQRAIEELISKLGTIDIAVTNAGGGGYGAPGMLEQPASAMNFEDMKRRFDSNFFGQVYTISAVAPEMKRKRYGKIVTIGSVSGLMARPDGSHADYGAAKHAVVHYTQALANELGPWNINVNCLAPGLIVTPRIANKYGDGTSVSDEVVQNVALRRLGTPKECATALEFLVSDDSSYISGAVLPVHGGTRIARWGAPPAPWWN